jgi:peptidase E
MTKYILHGGYTRAVNESNESFYEEFVSEVPDNGMILVCYFASKDTDLTKKFEQDKLTFNKAGKGKDFSCLFADENNFIEQLKKADALFMPGGSTPKLLGVLKKFPDLKENLEGKTIAGSSAGAYAIGKYSAFHEDESGGQIREGLGLLPLRVVCHYESADLPPNPQALSTLGNMAPDLEIVYLKDFEWKVFNF